MDKEKQKELLVDIMQADEKDGLYNEPEIMHAGIYIMTKKCTKCKEVKSFNEYCKDKNGRFGLYSYCKKCQNHKNKEWCEKNRDVKKECNKKYYKKNKEKIVKHNTDYKIKKCYNDPVFKLRKNISSLISISIKNNRYSKTSRTHDILGIDYQGFLNHLNANNYGFKYEDGLYDIDHIIPISSATTEEEVLKLNHYTNLQLLPSEYNRHVKRDNDPCANRLKAWLEGTKFYEVNGIEKPRLMNVLLDNQKAVGKYLRGEKSEKELLYRGITIKQLIKT